MNVIHSPNGPTSHLPRLHAQALIVNNTPPFVPCTSSRAFTSFKHLLISPTPILQDSPTRKDGETAALSTWRTSLLLPNVDPLPTPSPVACSHAPSPTPPHLLLSAHPFSPVQQWPSLNTPNSIPKSLKRKKSMVSGQVERMKDRTSD